MELPVDPSRPSPTAIERSTTQLNTGAPSDISPAAVPPTTNSSLYSPLSLEKQPYVASYPVQESPSVAPAARSQHVQWRPSLFHIGPLVGLGALLFAFIQIFAAFAILKASDGAAVADWHFQPNVYLAILTAVSNKALAFATVQGAVVTFWLSALKGTTLGDLHRNWGYGLYTYKAMMAGRHTNILAIACICATFVAMDGPLLQRASSVRLSVPDQNYTLKASITPMVPAYSTGRAIYVYLPGVGVSDFQKEFLPIFYDWAAGAPMKNTIIGCPGTCSAIVRGPALAIERCETERYYRNFTGRITDAEKESFANGCMAPRNEERVFFQDFMVWNGTTETLNYTTYVSDDAVAATCAGHVNKTSCSLVSAIAEYPVTITKSVLTLDEPHSYPKIIAKAKNTAITELSISQHQLMDNMGYIKSTLGGIATGANIAFYQMEGLVPWPGAHGQPGISPAPNLYAFQHITNYADMYGPLSRADCAQAWKDPRDQVMAALNEIMFRTGVYTAQHYDEAYLKSSIDESFDIHYNVTGRLTSEVEVFHSDFSYFTGAAAVELFTILIIMLTFYGWWRIGRDATLSPLEIAKAFDAPLLGSVPCNYNGRDIAKVEGTRSVKYGVQACRRTNGEQVFVLFESNRTNEH